VVRYDNRFFQVQAQSWKYAPAQGKVVVYEWQDGTLEIEYRGRKRPWKEIVSAPALVSAALVASPLFRVAGCAPVATRNRPMQEQPNAKEKRGHL
jgi:hypothetical protein